MQAKTLKFWTVMVTALLISGFFVVTLSFGQEMPAPGTTIDKTNYKKYAHLFPEEFLASHRYLPEPSVAFKSATSSPATL